MKMNDIQANTLNVVAAIAGNKSQTVIYTDEDGVTSLRLVTPRSIERSLNGETIVRLFDHLRRESRTFRLDRFKLVLAPGEEVSDAA